MELVQAYCHRCGKPIRGMSALASEPCFVFHKACAKAEEVYQPPARTIEEWRRNYVAFRYQPSRYPA